MQTIIFAGPYGTPFSARYGFVVSRDAGGFQSVTIVILQPKDDEQMSLISSRDSRDSVLNRILKNDLEGVRMEYVRCVLIVELSDRFEGREIPITLDVADYQAKGNPVEVEVDEATGMQTVSYHSSHVVAGCAKFGTPLEGSQRISDEAAKVWLANLGYVREHTPVSGH